MRRRSAWDAVRNGLLNGLVIGIPVGLFLLSYELTRKLHGVPFPITMHP